MAGELSALCAALKSQMAPELLDAPLDRLELPALDEEARELLLGSHEAGLASSLRELLSEQRLARFLDESCTQRERELLCAALGRLLRGDGLGPDDPARLVELPQPPRQLAQLRGWAEQHGVADELSRPAREVLPELGPTCQESMAELCTGTARAGRGQSLLAREHDCERVRAQLWREARRRAAVEAREALWRSTRPAEPLRRLCERLSAFLDGRQPRELAALELLPTAPVALTAHSGVCTGQLRGTDRSSAVQATLFLLGFEQRALSGQCSACTRPGCLHVKALAGRLLDACLLPSDALHAQLSAFARVPSWQRFFEAVQGPPELAESARERLSFVLRVQGESAHIAVLISAQGSDGSYSTGRMLAPQRALTRAACTDADRLVLEALAAKSRTLAASFLPVDAAVLRALIDHPHVRLEPQRGELRVLEEVLELKLVEQPEGLVPELRLAGQTLRPGARPRGTNYVLRLDPLPDAHGAAPARLIFAGLPPALTRLLKALETFRGVLPKESFATLAPYAASLQKVARVELPSQLLGLTQPPPRRLLVRLSPSFDEGVELTLSVRPFVLSGLWPPGRGPELVHGLLDGKPSHARRDLAWEREAAERAIRELALDQAIFIEAFRYRVESTQAALELLSRAAKLGDLLDIEWAEHVKRPELAGTVQAGDLKVGLFKRGALLFPEGTVQTPGVTLALGQLLEAARRSERFVRIQGDHYVEIEAQLFQRLQQAQLVALDVRGTPALSASAVPFWLKALGDVTRGEDAESTRLLEAAGSLDYQQLPLGQLLSLPLRDYQRDGVRFLLQRASWSPGACLADEMGLGKTVQAIALLTCRTHEGPALVVCPTSLVDNWQRELTRLAPQLCPVVYRGARRKKLLSQLQDHSVVITSYELLLRDRDHFDGLTFGTQIVDEGQVVKNARTLRARAVSSIAARFRLALSGTPLENRLGDLWSLFHLLTPGLLGSWPRFRARFAVPIERYDHEQRKQDLRNLVSPFILRRTKDDVAAELPARTEVVHLVELSQAERNLYNSALESARRAIGKRKKHDAARSMHILAELTRLRQLACHARLVIDDARIESSKLKALLTLLDDILPRGHRALIFSQFTSHLALIREALAARGIEQLWLSGETPAAERSLLVARFQAGEGRVFLISLKAGGTGLNLTAADYVVHMDPWWNPAAEDQASDRTHRIGQLRPVTVVKLVAADTIEERVLGLHVHKRRLADAVLGGQLRAPSSEDLATLLEQR